MSSNTNYKMLDLADKVKVIQLYEKTGKGSRALAVLKRKREHLDDYEKNAPRTKKRRNRITGNEEGKVPYSCYKKMRVTTKMHQTQRWKKTTVENPSINYSDALDAMEELKLFLAKKKKLGNCLKEVSSLEDKLETYCYEARSMAKQKKMHNFFAPASNK